MIKRIKNNFNKILGSLHRSIGGTRCGKWFARKIGNQAAAIIRAGLNDGIDMEDNGELWLIKIIAPKSTYFIDVGANIGNWTKVFLEFGKIGVRGQLFEPSPETLNVLQKNIKTMVNSNLIDISSSAVSDSIGTKKFFCEARCGETSSLIKGHSQTNALEILVNLTTIDLEVKRLGNPFIDVLKIDAEGYDLHVIKGASECIKNARIGLIQFEYNQPWANAGSTLYEALSIFSNHGYVVFLLRKDGLHKFNYHLYGEFFGYSNFIALSPHFATDFEKYIV
jgi:FkbM family methyltransferase